MKIVAVCGSLQVGSANAAVLRAARDLVGDDVEFVLFDGLEGLPHFNPDREENGPPPEVTRWRHLLGEADAVLIASPEYAHSLPGALKDALDWIVGSGELYGKTVALMSAGTGGGPHALEDLRRTLTTQGAVVVAALGVAGVRSKTGPDGEIADAGTRRDIARLMASLVPGDPPPS
jgi:NAD(P)H-dependent FMN reductase